LRFYKTNYQFIYILIRKLYHDQSDFDRSRSSEETRESSEEDIFRALVRSLAGSFFFFEGS